MHTDLNNPKGLAYLIERHLKSFRTDEKKKLHPPAGPYFRGPQGTSPLPPGVKDPARSPQDSRTTSWNLHGIGYEIYQHLKDPDMTLAEVNPVIDPEAGKYVLEVMPKESGTGVWYHCWAYDVILKEHEIEAVILETKSGQVAVRPEMVVCPPGII
jgi:hypothetical protein